MRVEIWIFEMQRGKRGRMRGREGLRGGIWKRMALLMDGLFKVGRKGCCADRQCTMYNIMIEISKKEILQSICPNFTGWINR